MKVRAISFPELTQNLKKFGFKGPYSGGKHLFMIKGNLRLTLPNPHRKEINQDLLLRILKQANISREEWISKFYS
ncbi:MAG: type II toxin-antitoxin system HicA family toxin [Atribacter sp.]|jgi:predicted RNA binding protein YcfA (HicA-like mRNA interferase family)|uniref:type II toxin-antitoxin system HicA family toxin n=1 Tax=Atribacter sp. TaxID=2847780 RepID=UPI003D9982F8